VTPTARRWVTPGGARLDLKHLTNTSGHLDPTLRDGGALDGYCLTVTHPRGQEITTTYLGGAVPEAELRAAFESVDAYEVTGLPTPPRKHDRPRNPRRRVGRRVYTRHHPEVTA
jgi:hypothetical protein